MNTFANIFKQAETFHGINKELQKIKDEELLQAKLHKEEDTKNKRKNNVKNYNYETDCYSKEMLCLIKKFGFSIEAYEKFENFSDDDYEPTLEIYYCRKNNWFFEVHNYSDVDITEGIFALKNIKHVDTGETVDFYCDLGCRNTGESRLEEVLNFFEFDSLHDFVNEKHKRYIELPKMLRDVGYNVEEKDYSFGLNKTKGYLQLDKNLFVKAYTAWMSDIKLVVTNDNKWDVNSANHSVRGGREKAYYFNYESESCFSELCKCIEAFKEDQAGNIGYFENNRYYNNNDIFKLFHSIEKTNKEAWNHYKIQIKHQDYWDCRGYDEENSLIPNKYKGLEIYTKTELTFNDAAQWTVGEYANKSVIIFEYDKRKNPDKCKLLIKNYIYKDTCELSSYNEETEQYEYSFDDEKLVENIEMYGTFTEIYSILENYVRKMCEIHEINFKEVI